MSAPTRLRRTALALLAQRDHSAAELRRKLRRRGGDAAATDDLVEDLIGAGWVDDQRFTAVFVQSRTARGFGPLRIAGELRERGISTDTVQAAVWESGETWPERAETARRKRFGAGLPKDRSERGRQGRFLEQRGFTREQVRCVLRPDRRNGKLDD